MTDAPLDPASGRRSSGTASASGSPPGRAASASAPVSVASGLSVAQTCALSLLVFTGASQFALVGVVAPGRHSGRPHRAAARHPQHPLRLRDWRPARVARARRLLGAQVLIDESTAMSITRRPARRPAWASWSGWSIFVLWNLATLVGAIAGDALGDPGATAWTRRSERRSSRCCGRGWTAPQPAGGARRGRVALATVPVVPAGVPVLAAAAVALLAGLLTKEPAS